MAEIVRLGKYEVRRELGRGAMGVVYEGHDPLIDRIVALKTIRAEQLVGDNAPQVLARFRREAQAAGRLAHPNIVAIYDFDEAAGVWYIAMELVNGRELKEYFERNERFSTADSVRILAQILAALGYSHRLGVVHRDIKPSNIFLLPDRSVKVADFGIAHLESSELTQVGTVLGTPAYMSPEQIQGLPVDGRSDLFSVGVILYQFLTGERPFTGSGTTTMRKVLEEHPLPPSRFNVQIPGAMDGVVRRALAKRPEDRFQTAEEFANALQAAAMAEPEHTGDTTLMPPPARGTLADATTGEHAGKDGTGTRAAAGAPAAIPPARKSQRAAMVVVASTAALAVGVAVWFVWQRPAASVERAAQPALPSPAVAASPPPPAAPAPASPPVPATSRIEPGAMLISAVGLVDPSEARYQSDAALLQSELRADSRSQLVEKAVGLLVDGTSLAQNYDLVKHRLLARSGTFVTTVVRESEPRVGKDGLMSITTEGVVNVKAVQKSLNEMSRSERIEFIRASGDPRVAVHILVRDADRPDVPPLPSAAAENILKQRIKSFGFRTWSEGDARAGDDRKGADFAIEGVASIKKLFARLSASGLVVTKYALNAWTIKCIDRLTGEEIYYNTVLPAGAGSWASEEEALNAIGTRIANEFSRDFFLQHVNVTSRRVTLRFEALPDPVRDETLVRELVGLPAVLAVSPPLPARPRVFDLQLAGSAPLADVLGSNVLKPLNAKLGQACFSVGAVAGDEIAAVFDPRCANEATLGRLESNPPAGLYGAPAGRQKAVVKNPEMLRKLAI